MNGVLVEGLSCQKGGAGILYKLSVAALPIAVSHDYNARAHQRIWAVDAELGGAWG